MKFFVFDLDETLAELESVHYFLSSLNPNAFRKNSTEYSVKPSEEIYKIFVNKVLEQELSESPLGFLRPGILYIMKQLKGLQDKHIIQNVVIYSNNGHLGALEFVRDLIHAYVKSDNLIKDCIHLTHQLRYTDIKGSYDKTWKTLKNILINGNTKSSEEIQPSDVYFFDDLIHSDLKDVLKVNYYKVPAYTYIASFDRIASIFKDSVYSSRDSEKFIKYMINSVYNKYSLDRIIDEFKKQTSHSIEKKVPEPDSGIKMMQDAINSLKMQGGKRKKKLKLRTRRNMRGRLLTIKY
jgi:hypothetical protein